MPDHNPNSEHQSMLWGFLGIVLGIVGLVCYALSSSFKHLFGEWKSYKFLLYIMISLIICGVVLFAKKIQVSNSSRVKAHVVFLVLMITSVYSFFYDKTVNENPDALSIVSYAAFALTALCFSRKFELGFEVGFFYFFLGCLIVQLMKIHLILAVLGAVFSYSLIFVRSYLDSEVPIGATRSDENSNEEIQPDAQSNVFSESTEQDNVSPEIQSNTQFNIFSESTEQYNIYSEIQSDIQSSQLRRRHQPREPNDDVNYRPLVAEHFSAIGLLIALGPGRLICQLCTATIHFLNSWWKKIRRWREKIQVSSSSWVEAHMGFFILMLASLYYFLYYEVAKGNQEFLSIVPYAALAAFALTSLCFSRKLKLVLDVVSFHFLLGCVTRPRMTIQLILAGFVCCPFIVLYYLDSQDRTGTPRSGVNLEQTSNDRANGVSNQADSNEEEPTEEDNIF